MSKKFNKNVDKEIYKSAQKPQRGILEFSSLKSVEEDIEEENQESRTPSLNKSASKSNSIRDQCLKESIDMAIELEKPSAPQQLLYPAAILKKLLPFERKRVEANARKLNLEVKNIQDDKSRILQCYWKILLRQGYISKDTPLDSIDGQALDDVPALYDSVRVQLIIDPQLLSTKLSDSIQVRQGYSNSDSIADKKNNLALLLSLSKSYFAISFRNSQSQPSEQQTNSDQLPGLLFLRYYVPSSKLWTACKLVGPYTFDSEHVSIEQMFFHLLCSKTNGYAYRYLIDAIYDLFGKTLINPPAQFFNFS